MGGYEMKMKTCYLLVMGGDLTDDGLQIGPITAARLGGAVAWTRRQEDKIVMCLAAGYSPAHPNQTESMATLMANRVRSNCPDVSVQDILGHCAFNTRGELGKFMGWISEQEVSMESLFISSAWWHVPRVKWVFADMFGEEIARRVSFVETAEEFPPRLRFLEAGKTIFNRFPARWRYVIEGFVRRTGFNPSW